MADIFISYKREDKNKAQMISEKLEASGFSVWWDHDLLGGQDYDVVIKKELEKAKCVIVIWSELSVQSRNVKDEAKYAINHEILVPVSFDNTEPPIGFGMTHVLVFENPNKVKDEEYNRLFESVKNKTGTVKPDILPEPEFKNKKTFLIVLATISLFAALYFVIPLLNNNETIHKPTNEDTIKPSETEKEHPVTELTEREKIGHYLRSIGQRREISFLNDTITHYRIKSRNNNSVTLEVDYSYNSQHGANVFLGAKLWQFGTVNVGGRCTPQLLSSPNGTAVINIWLSPAELNSIVGSKGFLVFMNERFKPLFHARIFEYPIQWTNATAVPQPHN